MKFLKNSLFIAVAASCMMLFATVTASAQTAKIQDLSYSDYTNLAVVKALYGDQAASLSSSSAFLKASTLAVEEVTLAADKEEGYYFLSFSLEDSDDETEIVIIDVMGNKIHDETIEEFEGTYESKVNIPATQKGTYFLKVVQGFSLMNKKLVIE